MNKNKDLSELNSKEFFWYNLRRRIFFYFGWIFIYVIPISIICSKFSIITKVKSTNSVDLTFLIIGLFYLVFLSKHFKKKIANLKVGALKSFFSGITSLIPVIILAIFVQMFQNILNEMPTLDVSKYLWLIIESIAIGLLLQIIDAAINVKYLYKLEVYKTAKKEVDVEKEKEKIRSRGK